MRYMKKRIRQWENCNLLHFYYQHLVISGLYAKDENFLVNHVYTLLSTACFFFAYIYLMSFRLTNFKWFFVPGMASLIAAFYYIFRAGIGIALVALDLNNKLHPEGDSSTLYLISYILIISFVFILTAFSLSKIKNTEFSRHKHFNKITKYLFYFLYGVIFILMFYPPNTLDYKIALVFLGCIGVDILALSTLIIHNIRTIK